MRLKDNRVPDCHDAALPAKTADAIDGNNGIPVIANREKQSGHMLHFLIMTYDLRLTPSRFLFTVRQHVKIKKVVPSNFSPCF
jgi:hypothetical protein